MNVETWCKVEASPLENHLRTQRKHYPDALKSTVFDVHLPDRFSDMHTNKTSGMRVDEIQKRRHFKEKCKF